MIWRSRVLMPSLIGPICFPESSFTLAPSWNSHGGWFAYVPYTNVPYSPGWGMDFYNTSLILLAIATTGGAINFIVTILHLRAPGMAVSRMPLFLYSTLTVSLVTVFSLPSLTAANIFLEARSQFQQALATVQKMGALELTANAQSELAALDIAEGHADLAESEVRAALNEFDKEKSDPNLSSAYTLLSRALLLQGKIDEARKASHRGAELSLTSSDPAQRLPAEIQQARVEMAGNNSTNSEKAESRLRSSITTARRLGYYNIECEARLVMDQLQLKSNSSLGHKQLKALASETRSDGYELIRPASRRCYFER